MSDREALRRLVEKWRELVVEHKRQEANDDNIRFLTISPARHNGAAKALTIAADELAALLDAAPEPETPPTCAPDPFGDHVHGHRAAAELAKIIEIVRFTPGQASGYHLSAFQSSELILKWASKWSRPHPPEGGDHD